MMDGYYNSTVNRCVHGGKHGDFHWPYNVPDGAFGPWSPLCKSELLDPTAPCRPYIGGQPCNFKELAFLFSSVLHAVVTLCHDIPPAGDPGNPEWIDPRLTDIDDWLDFKWMNCYSDLSDQLKDGINKYLFVILKEAVLRQNYVYFTKYPELQETLKVVYEAFDGCSWGELDKQINLIANLILSYGKQRVLLSFELNVQVISGLGTSWVELNNTALKIQKDLSLMICETIVSKNLTLTETIKEYSQTEGVLRFEIIQNHCAGNISYNLKYGNGKFNVRKNTDFLTVAKTIFGT